jgi:hypothetical protein
MRGRYQKTKVNREAQVIPPSGALALNIIVGFILFVTAITFVAPTPIVNVTVPAGALIVAIILYTRYPISYVEFNLWACFLSPLVRRLIDYQGGTFTNPSPILLIPYLVVLPAIMTVFRHPPKLKHQGGFLFILVFSSLMYGFFIGIINSPFQGVAISSLEWISPVIFGWHLVSKWQDYPVYAKIFQRAFFWFILLAGAYGIYQFMVAPEWDAFWLTHIIEDLDGVTFGNPNPLEIRVWGTMHGPFVFAVALSAGLLLLLSRKDTLSVIAIIIGMLSFLLTQVRSSWIGFIVGLAMLVTSMKQNVQIRLILIIFFVAACVVALSTIDSFAEVISTRVSSLSEGQNDNSAVGRTETYKFILSRSLANLLGDGFSKSAGGDSGLLDILVRLGWLGGLCYFSGLILLAVYPMNCPEMRTDLFARTTNAIVINLIAQVPLGNVISQTQGIILWGFIGMRLAAWKYHSQKSQSDFISSKSRYFNYELD